MNKECRAAKRRYDSAIRRKAKAKADAEAARVDMQLNCNHEQIAEAPYRHDEWGHHHQPDFRVCLGCGFSEEGWGCGYQILCGEVGKNISRDEGYGLRIGPTFRNHLFVEVCGSGLNTRKRYEMAVKRVELERLE